MKKGIVRFMALLLIFGSVINGCSQKTKYERRLKYELASGVRYDSLFMGLYLGMPQKDFYNHCWLLNKKGLVKQGEGNASVEYQLKKGELKYPARMDFYPKFSEAKISEMDVRFAYSGWAPWNKELSSDKLQTDVLKWYEKTYGHGFIEAKHLEKGSAYVRVDGNRRISIYKENDLYVWAVFTDMLANRDSVTYNSGTENRSNDSAKAPEKKTE
jgi:hypothetical protein